MATAFLAKFPSCDFSFVQDDIGKELFLNAMMMRNSIVVESQIASKNRRENLNPQLINQHMKRFRSSV